MQSIKNFLKRIPWKSILIVLAVLIVSAGAYIFWPQTVDLSYLANSNQGYDVRILRDTWGIPHIYGVTDADAGFGLAYANAEDDFLTVQQTLLAGRGILASVEGPDAAPIDYTVQLLRIWDAVDAQYETALAPETRALMEAYADGINYYAALHPEEVLTDEAFPVTGKDIVAASVLKSPLFFGLDGMLGELFAAERKSEVSPRPLGDFSFTGANLGSNTFAVSPLRTSDGSTYLDVNSHQPWEGAVAWFEAHVHSEEGWDMTGGLFPGSPVVLHGHNQNLGWAFTVNEADLADIYVLEINPDDDNQYKYDGEWLDLEVRPAPIKVKILGNFSWTVTQEALWSVYGPVVRQDHGVYAIRYAGMERIDIWEQLFRMNKAENFEEWQAAMSSGALPTFNVGYADREGNIYYLFNADLPIRAEGYQWDMYLPGDTSEVLWTEYLPFEDLPQVFNPSSGFIQNCNSTPFQTTIGPDNPNPDDYSPTFGIETRMSNRALRALELFGEDESITWEEFVAYKFDMKYSTKSDVAKIVSIIINQSDQTNPDVVTGATQLINWDLTATPDNASTALVIYTIYFMDRDVEGFSGGRLVGNEFEVKDVLDSFQNAVDYMKEKHGRFDVLWGEVNRLIRGDLDLGVGGAPDVLHAVYGGLQEDGRFWGSAGDSFVMLVRWNADGQVSSQAIHQYGSATLDEASPHYADQSLLFVQRQLRPVWFTEADIRANLEREYRPGEEILP